jgi:hypothetical protein
MRDAAAALSGAALEQPAPEGWSAKEMLAHVAFWEEAAIYVIEHMLRGKPEPTSWPFPSGYDPLAVAEDWPSDDVHNAREAAWARERDVSVVLDRLDRAHEDLTRLLRTITDDEAVEHAAYLREVHAHFDEHLGDLQA